MISERFHNLVILIAGACLGAMAYAVFQSTVEPVHAQESSSAPDLEGLAQEIEKIKGKLPDQAHAMQDVGYHFANLWFAGQGGHWELANFYWLETRSHLRWAIRIIPLRKDNAGKDVDVKAILEAFENGELARLQAVISEKDKTAFEKVYRSTLEACYACHKASDKPFIRPQVPTESEATIINFDPSAEWPL